MLGPGVRRAASLRSLLVWACAVSALSGGEPARADARCPECLEAVTRSQAYWKTVFDEHLGERPMDAGMYGNLVSTGRRHPGFGAFLAEELSEANHPQGNWRRLVHRSHPGLPDLGIYDDEPRWAALTKALYCDRYPSYGDADYMALLATADRRAGYFDTHLLMALLILERNGCRDAEELERHRNRVADRLMAGVLHEPGYHDLLLERIAFLYWAGYGDRMRREWIQTVLDHQSAEDHGWPLAPGGESHPHASSLAVLVLAYYADGGAQQEIYYPVHPESDSAPAPESESAPEPDLGAPVPQRRAGAR